jgi:hypothetical protein
MLKVMMGVEKTRRRKERNNEKLKDLTEGRNKEGK